MEKTSAFVARRWPERWYRRPSTWMMATVAALGLAFVSSRATGLALLGVAGLCALVAATLMFRGVKEARARMVGMIDEHLEARSLHQGPETEEDTRKRAGILAMRQRLSR